MSVCEELEENGYVVIPDVVSSDVVDAAVEAIWRRLELIRSLHPLETADATKRGMFPLWNAKELWDVRGSEGVQSAFADALGSNSIWASLDRCGLKLKGHPSRTGLALHWDDDDSRWDYAELQGVVALLPSLADSGGFVCHPNSYRAYRDAGKEAALRTWKPGTPLTSVEIPQGGLLLFDHRLLHGTGPHSGNHDRAVQYVSFAPSTSGPELARRVACWQDGTWRGSLASILYEIPDARSPSLSCGARRALYGLDA